jgi:predicted Fe-Mo cluster-binding NifX family protein
MLNNVIDPRFGRAPYFIIVDSDTMAFKAISNSASEAMHGAGIQAAQTILKNMVNVVITGNVGPNAFQALSSAGIEIVTGATGTIQDVVEKYKRGELNETKNPTVGGHFGIGGGGIGRGRGSGMGRRQ